MTEALVVNEIPLVVPPQFNKLPYCSPDITAHNSLDVLLTFDPAAVASDPQFVEWLSDRYEENKADTGDPNERSSEPTLDLTKPEHADGMAEHTLIHSVTGLIDAGVSNSRCIPYWDREAAIVGTQRHNPEGAALQIELMDVFGINVLRSYCHYLARGMNTHGQHIRLIDVAMRKGQRSMLDMRPFQEDRLERNAHEFDEYADLYTAKLKHLMWLVDQQQNPTIRHCLMSEIRTYVDFALTSGILPEELTVDMGRDTGISASTDRPPYDISMFVQLAHLHTPGQSVQTYSLPQRRCRRLSINTLWASMGREGWELPAYEDGRYQLPWRFAEESS